MSVEGVDAFKKAMRGFKGSYVLIGGSACDLLMEQQGERFRATKDLDVVIITNEADNAFARAFWGFVKAGGYSPWKRHDGGMRFYRFVNPSTAGYPPMIELFARHPGFHLEDEESEIAPLAFEEGVSSLSAIILDDGYYSFIKDGVLDVDGLSVLDAAHLIPLKMKAHIDLTARKSAGLHVNSNDLKKHRKDVFRLLGLVPSDLRIELNGAMAEDAKAFLEAAKDPLFRIDQLDLGMTLEEAVDFLKLIYRLNG